MSTITLGLLPAEFSIHRLSAQHSLADVLKEFDAPAGALNKSLFATLQSADELSIVCEASLAINAQHTSGPWRAMRVIGQLDFALTGILSGLAAPLAAAKISIFAISSYDTDYLLVNANDLESAVSVLENSGYRFSEPAN